MLKKDILKTLKRSSLAYFTDQKIMQGEEPQGTEF